MTFEITSDRLRAFLDTLDFPATKEEIVRYAGATARPDDAAIVKALRALPLGDYGNREEVVRSTETAEATGTSRSAKAGTGTPT